MIYRLDGLVLDDTRRTAHWQGKTVRLGGIVTRIVTALATNHPHTMSGPKLVGTVYNPLGGGNLEMLRATISAARKKLPGLIGSNNLPGGITTRKRTFAQRQSGLRGYSHYWLNLPPDRLVC